MRNLDLFYIVDTLSETVVGNCWHPNIQCAKRWFENVVKDLPDKGNFMLYQGSTFSFPETFSEVIYSSKGVVDEK